MWNAVKNILKGIALLYFALFMLLLGMIAMTNLMLAGLQ